MESEENEKNKEVNNKEEEEEEEEWVVIDSDVVRNEIERQRSLSASTPPPSMTITTPLLRPQSAQDVHSRQGKKGTNITPVIKFRNHASYMHMYMQVLVLIFQYFYIRICTNN